MTKINRVSQKIFGQDAPVNEVGVFGSLAAGLPQTSKNLEEIQSLSQYLDGWKSATIGNNADAIQDRQGLDYLTSYQLAYLFQQGVAEYNTDTEYHTGSFVSDNSKIYLSLQDDNLNNPLSDLNFWKEYNKNNVLPSLRQNDWNTSDVADYLKEIHVKNGVIEAPRVPSYVHGATVGSSAYRGGVYSPTQDRIYLVPYGQGDDTLWHYIDCTNGKVVAYTHGATVVQNGYLGGVYSPINNRIYLIPFNQVSGGVPWHYIDCDNGLVVSYASGLSSSFGCRGGVYSPTQDRVYLAPYNQVATTAWYYIDCSTATVVQYTHGATVTTEEYYGGVYSPTQNRIYFVPDEQANQTDWHYVDCNTGNIVAYTHGLSGLTTKSSGGVYSPTQNRIYFVPNLRNPANEWIYINCDDGAVVSYVGSPIGSNAYSGGVYNPTQNRIYFVPLSESTQTVWHYIDCSDGSVVDYNHNTGIVLVSPYVGGVYSPTQNRIYLVPLSQSNQPVWHYIAGTEQAEIAPKLMAGAVFNKY